MGASRPKSSITRSRSLPTTHTHTHTHTHERTHTRTHTHTHTHIPSLAEAPYWRACWILHTHTHTSTHIHTHTHTHTHTHKSSSSSSSSSSIFRRTLLMSMLNTVEPLTPVTQKNIKKKIDVHAEYSGALDSSHTFSKRQCFSALTRWGSIIDFF